ncbi:DNA helicase RecQ [Heyndrickxia sporothermodurans]|uniref:DNA helicase RecQ n=1 Tax=Heyndrickxia sporothermodurans TaxID=46224 RepID=UPI002DBDE901|nr:DNA helicase RecQ [Heyndrickxia sporothermodurans]MEB6551214.1 DNA helicase RecQ [Heyndrickxia sporothermodurans]MED3650496.1 DNA helicase RecQ [Heyndrickxia sporothermodurans]MED3654448.1 DNA helicase RecQ [Heyndrickxia sporothermodurans]MED3698422.1 DNA helicase RecQ [Heyndrickxia sporothermodurans]MED3781008.1 DNA helicase RecQ [Heyndrickxia sporothermodurans]
MLNQAKKILQDYYGYEDFRRGQNTIIEQVLEGKDTVAIMPTGGGKSICYQVPAMILPGVTIVISPLISLMKDQVDALINAGIPATFINSSISNSEMQERLQGIMSNDYKLLYVAPERLEAPSFIEMLNQIDVSMIAIDEAHCISQWGHDFRPSYLLIKKFIQSIQPKPVILALTATATPQVKDDICALLDIPLQNVVLTGFGRENLIFKVVKGQDRDLFMEEYIKKNNLQSGIIYAATRKEVERIYLLLKKRGIQAGKYHAGMPEKERNENQDQFLYDNIQVMVATSAFGMGINKSNVRYVLHYHIPRNMESYYQEAGRAGRDGVESECILMFAPQDVHIQKFLIDQSEMDDERKENEYGKLRKMISYCHTESCFQQYILEYFGEENATVCRKCGNCTDDRIQVDVTKEAQMVLSCIKRMNERFGKTFITKVLTGSSDKKIKSFGFNKLSTYGIMKERTQKEVNELIDFLTAEGYLRPTDGQYPVLMLTNQAVEVLRGESTVLRKERVKVKQLIEDNQLFERLRKLRKEIADMEKVPPYIIFSDQSLKEMSAKLPTSKNELLQIKGVGERKLEQYGDAFITVITSYCEENGIAVEKHDDFIMARSETTKDDKEKSHHVTFSFLQQGLTIDEIAAKRNMTIRTIEGHLIKCAEEGISIDWDQFIPSQYEELIKEAVREADTQRLTPIKQLLPEEISFFMIRAFLQREKEQKV